MRPAAPSPTLRFAPLWERHPARQDDLYPCRSDNGEPRFENQCAVRMGVALQRAGFSLSTFKGARCWYKHADVHPLRAQELADWLASTIAGVKKRKGALASEFAGRTGIVFFRDFWGAGNRGDHIDVWDGSRMAHGDNDYFERAKEVWFWEVA